MTNISLTFRMATSWSPEWFCRCFWFWEEARHWRYRRRRGPGGKHRWRRSRATGKDFSWVEVERFQHQDDFEQSALWAEIKETMSSTRNSRNDEAQFKHYRCKYKRKGGWLPCERSYKVGSHLYWNSFLLIQERQIYFSKGGLRSHIHSCVCYGQRVWPPPWGTGRFMWLGRTITGRQIKRTLSWRVWGTTQRTVWSWGPCAREEQPMAVGGSQLQLRYSTHNFYP